jgi:hypothetical protein
MCGTHYTEQISYVRTTSSSFHIEQAYLKSTFAEVWEKEPDFLMASCTRFREDVIANPYLCRYWQ